MVFKTSFILECLPPSDVITLIRLLVFAFQVEILKAVCKHRAYSQSVTQHFEMLGHLPSCKDYISQNQCIHK